MRTQHSSLQFDLLPDDLVPVVLVGKTSRNTDIVSFSGLNPLGGYYLCEVDGNGVLVYTSPTNNPKDLRPVDFMGAHDLLLNLIKVCPPNSYEVSSLEGCLNLLHARHLIDYHNQAKKEAILDVAKRYFGLKKEAKKPVKEPAVHSNAQAGARKFAQKEKILDRWSDIAPVFLDSAHKEIGAKIKGRCVYINLDDQKPEFLLINKTNTQPMSITDLAQFMGVLGENKGFESVAEHIAIYYQKFSAIKAKRARPKRAHEIDIKIKNALYDKIESLSNISRAQMAKRVQEQMEID